MNNLPKLNQLQAFLAVLKNGGFRKAAIALNLTQPAITHSISGLEKSMGVSLFSRKGQGVNLTKEGEFLSERAQFLIDTYDSVVNDIKQIHNNKAIHELSLGVSSFSLLSDLPSKISDLQIDFPRTKIKIIENELPVLLRMLRTGQLDLIIYPDSEQFVSYDLIEKDFFQSRVCILASIDNPLRNIKSIAEFDNVKWFLSKSKVNYYNNLKIELKDKMKNDNLVVSGGGVMSLLMASNSDFITLAPEIILRNTPLAQGLQEIKLKESLPDISYKFVYSRHFPLKKAAAELISGL